MVENEQRKEKERNKETRSSVFAYRVCHAEGTTALKCLKIFGFSISYEFI